MHQSSTHVLPAYNPHHPLHPPVHHHHHHPNQQPLPMQNGIPNGQPPPAQQSQPALPQASHRQPPPPPTPKERIDVHAVPSFTVRNSQVFIGDSQSSSLRSYTPLKLVGDGSFGTVWLCDWHGTLPPNTPLSPMQCGAGARPEYSGKRLVAVKRMRKRWEGGWDECKKLKELEALRAIPYHPNIIPLYDFFLLPDSKELYFVFESMEGNLYQLIKSRRSRPLAGGLVSSIFQQVVTGLYHVHASGYFHRDMKPENLLVTTTGLHDYISVSPVAAPSAPPEKDVKVIIKLADFGLARETKSKPPYTEYVSTRWYRAPEVLLRSRDYSNPVDMWALGAIMAELVNLKPLFPGHNEVDQMVKICELLGDPSDLYGVDQRGKAFGGGKWPKGVKMAKAVGFSFAQVRPKDIYRLFDRSVPPSLIECIADMLKYEPDARLTSRQLLDHPYITEVATRNIIPPLLHVSTVSALHSPPPHATLAPSARLAVHPHARLADSCRLTHHARPVAESHTHRTPFVPGQAPVLHHVLHPSLQSTDQVPMHLQTQDWDMEIVMSPAAQEDPSMPREIEPTHEPTRMAVDPPSHVQKGAKLGLFGKKPSKWNIGGFFGPGGHAKEPSILTPVEEINVASSTSTPSLKRTQSSSTDSRSLPEVSPVRDPSPPPLVMDPKRAKKEAEQRWKEAEMARRQRQAAHQKEQARAVMQKRHEIIRGEDASFLERGMSDMTQAAVAQAGGLNVNSFIRSGKIKQNSTSTTGPIRGSASASGANTVSAASGRFSSKSPSNEAIAVVDSRWRESERVIKARRRDYEDDLSSSDVHSIGRMSVMSFATVDSDPGPSRLRGRQSMFGINRMQSASSLRTSFGDELSISGRSSVSIDGQLANEFDIRASFDTSTSFSHQSEPGSLSPPAMQGLSLGSPSHLQTWHPHPDERQSRRSKFQSYITLPPPVGMNPQHLRPPGPGSPYEYQGLPPSSGSVNSMFKVPLPSPSSERATSQAGLPPFSQLEAVAERNEYPPLSPMSFTEPDET